MPRAAAGIALCAALLAFAGCSRKAGEVRVIVSSAAGDRLAEKPSLPLLAEAASGAPVITVDDSKRYQTMEGFGATFNEAGLMVLNQLDASKQEDVLRSLFDPAAGAGFTLMKAPLAACDFAAAGGWYTYDDVPGDVTLKHFSIERDLGPNGQVTFIRRARKHGAFKIQATTDYPPDWMLDSKMSLQPRYHDAFARYLVKYVQEYAREGIEVDYLSPFNEPQFIYCKIPFAQIRDLIKKNIGPRFREAGLSTKLQVSDSHTRKVGLENFPTVLDDPEARQYISVMPVHGYQWEKEGSELMGKLHEKYPGLAVWQTEVCYAKVIDHRPMPVHGFEDGDRWGRMIIADLQNWAAGWIYWNMILDHNGGPWLVSLEHENPEDNPQHAVVIIDTDKKQPVYTGLYYYLAHFSKFVRPGAVRIGSEGATEGLSLVAFQSQGGGKVLEVVNSAKAEAGFTVQDGGRSFRASAPAMSITTFLWQ